MPQMTVSKNFFQPICFLGRYAKLSLPMEHRLRLHRLLHLCQLRLHGSIILQRYQLRLDRLLHLQLCLQMILRRHQLHLYWCLLLLNLSLILVVYILLFLLLR